MYNNSSPPPPPPNAHYTQQQDYGNRLTDFNGNSPFFGLENQNRDGLLPLPQNTRDARIMGAPTSLNRNSSPGAKSNPNSPYSPVHTPNLLTTVPPTAGFLSPAFGPTDWQHQFLHVAKLQNLTAGYLSPAGHPAIATPGQSINTASGPPQPVYASPQISPELMIQGFGQYSSFQSPSTAAISPDQSKQTMFETASPPTSATIHGEPHSLTDQPQDSAELRQSGPLMSCVTDGGDSGQYFIKPWETSAWFGVGGPNTFPQIPGLPPLPDMVRDSTPAINPQQFNLDCDAPHFSDKVDIVLHAKSLTEQLLKDFSVTRAVEVLQASLALLGRPVFGADETRDGGNDKRSQGSLPWVKLVHPDDFKNPSTFLKIYGDPLCFAKSGPLPKKDRNGNWECPKCNNVNFPRRFRCNMCTAARDADGDWVVAEYARQVYERYLCLYRNQRNGGNDISIPILDISDRYLDENRQGGGGRQASSTASGGILPEYPHASNNVYSNNAQGINNARRRNRFNSRNIINASATNTKSRRQNNQHQEETSATPSPPPFPSNEKKLFDNNRTTRQAA